MTSNKEAENVEDQGITMVDVLEQEKELEEEYAAVLGASDEKFCTFPQGAIKRQALYSCLTCCPESKNDLEKCAGVCLACSYRCHENHDLVELYTKRNFRCDCPTERFSNNKCVLNSIGTLNVVKPQNANNKYNQNFQGLYCNCNRPYPDPERSTDEVMLQCCICEDWFHLDHIDATASAVELSNTYNEMICNNCMQRHEFLRDYAGFSIKTLEDVSENNTDISITENLSVSEENDNKLRSDLDKSISEIMNMSEVEEKATASDAEKSSKAAKTEVPNVVMEIAGEKTKRINNATNDESPKCKRAKLDDNLSDAKEEKVKPDKCRRPKGENFYKKGPTFWNNEWRSLLCQCIDCLKMYKRQDLEFLLDAEDSAKLYEDRGMKRAANEKSTYEQGINALQSIGRVQQIDAIMEYNHMKDKLKEFLQTFAINKKVVTEEDINGFFERMRNEKNANVGQPNLRRK